MKFLIYVCAIVVCLGSYKYSQAQVNFSSSNLPIVVINTHGQTIPNEPKIEADMGIIFNGEGELNHIYDPYNHYNGKIGIEMRGSSSQFLYPKKQYAVETRDDLGNNYNVSLLGMPEENDWILYAPYGDKSLFRNVLIYKLSNEMGHYATRTHFCELMLNGSYQGIYILMERIKRDKNRVNISNLAPEDITGDALTGGYIIKIDKEDGSNIGGWHSTFPPYPGASQRIYYQYHYPKTDEIVSEQANYIHQFFLGFEVRMWGTNYNDPFKGYYELLDLNSFADYIILNELSKNVDAYRLSFFMNKDRDSKGGKLKAGPLWDYNIALGNANYYSGEFTEGWQLDVPIFQDPFQKPFWWKKLWSNPVLSNTIACRWSNLRTDILHSDSLINYIDQMADSIEDARIRNFIRWPSLGTYVWPNSYIGATYDDELNYLKNWINFRLLWIDGNLSPVCSVVKWVNPSQLNLVTAVGNFLTVPVENFYNNRSLVDTVTFIGSDPNIHITSVNGMLNINSESGGEYAIKGLGWFNGAIKCISPAYVISVLTDVQMNPKELPQKFVLYQNYPNPFNLVTKIKYSIPHSSFSHRDVKIADPDKSQESVSYRVIHEDFSPYSTLRNNMTHISIIVFDILGNKIKTLVNELKPPGIHEVEFDASGLSSGIYYYRILHLLRKE